MARGKSTKTKGPSSNRTSLDQRAAELAADWASGRDVLGHFEAMSGPEAAYVGVLVFGVLGEAVEGGHATEQQRAAFLKALEEAAAR